MVLLHLTEISSLEPLLSMYRQASIGSSDYRSQRGEVQLLDMTRMTLQQSVGWYYPPMGAAVVALAATAHEL